MVSSRGGFNRWAAMVVVLIVSVLLAACNTAGELPPGPVTPIIPSSGAAATRSAQPAATAAAPQATPAAGQTLLPARPPSLTDGAQIYAQRCAPCHGAAGKGDGPQSQQIVAQMGGQLPNFADALYARAAKPADWFNATTQGRMTKGMPPFASLTDDQRWSVVAYLFTLALPQEQIAQGKTLYTAQCAQCHGPAGKPSLPGVPDLTSATTFARSQVELENVIANGRGAMPGFGNLSQAERAALSGYARSLAWAAEQPAAPAGQASIAGNILNGTTGAKTPPDVPVILYALAPDGSAIMYTRTVTSDAVGKFVFDKLDASPSLLYAVQVRYLKGNYTSDPLTFAHGGLTLTVPITVYETTTDAGVLRIEQMHLFFGAEVGTVSAGQLFIVSNPGDRAYLAADGTSVRLPLPPGAGNVSFEDGVLGGRYLPIKEGFADTEAILPGATQILVSYDLPYDGKRLEMALPLAYPVRSLNVLIPEGSLQLTSQQLAPAGTRATQGGNMINFVGGNLAAGQSLVLQLSGSIATGALAPGVGAGTPWAVIVAAALLLIAVAVVAYVWLRRQREATEWEEVEVEDVAARKEELLDALAALDDGYEAGRVSKKEYARQRGELKAELLQLMADDEGPLTKAE